MLYIHPDECARLAVRASRSVRSRPCCKDASPPEEWKGYYDANTSTSSIDLGSPGGAAKAGEIDHDHEALVAALPRHRATTSDLTRRRSRTVETTSSKSPVSRPDFPWDQAHGVRCDQARAHPDGIVDLSGRHPQYPTPTPEHRPFLLPRFGRRTAPGYPHTIGRPGDPASRELAGPAGTAVTAELGIGSVLPVIGRQGLVASPGRASVGLGPGAPPGRPPRARLPDRTPSARAVGPGRVAGGVESLTGLGPERPAPALARSPSNPTDWGAATSPSAQGRRVVPQAAGTILVSRRVLPGMCAGTPSRSRCCTPRHLRGQPPRASSPSTHSRSAPTWPATAAGSLRVTSALVAELLARSRKNLGLIACPAPSRWPWRSCSGRRRPRGGPARALRIARRTTLRVNAGVRRLPDRPLRGVPLPLGHPRSQDCWDTLGDLARLGILVAPAPGPAGERPRPGRPDRHRRARRRGGFLGRRRCPDTAPACGWSATSSQTRLQVMAQVLESIVSKRKSPHTGWHWRPLCALVDRVAHCPARDALQGDHVATGSVGRGQHDPRHPVRRHHPAAHGWKVPRKHERQASWACQTGVTIDHPVARVSRETPVGTDGFAKQRACVSRLVPPDKAHHFRVTSARC